MLKFCAGNCLSNHYTSADCCVKNFLKDGRRLKKLYKDFAMIYIGFFVLI